MRCLMAGAAMVLVLFADGRSDAQMIKQRPAAASDPNKVICRTQTITGSRLLESRKCLTRAQWTQLNREERETVEKVQRLYFDCKLTGMGC